MIVKNTKSFKDCVIVKTFNCKYGLEKMVVGDCLLLKVEDYKKACQYARNLKKINNRFNFKYSRVSKIIYVIGRIPIKNRKIVSELRISISTEELLIDYQIYNKHIINMANKYGVSEKTMYRILVDRKIGNYSKKN